MFLWIKYRRSSSLSIVLAITFTIINVFVYITSPHYRPCIDSSGQRAGKLVLLPFSQLNLGLGRWDSKRLYRMFDNSFVGRSFAQLSQKSQVTLATHTDPEHLHHILEAAEHWHGPISVALFAKGKEEMLVFKAQLQFLQNCYRAIASRMSFHLVLPKIFVQETWDLVKFEKLLNEQHQILHCRSGKALQKFVNLWKPSENDTFRKEHLYPQNHLRNLARKNSQTSYVFVADVDIVPCLDMWESLDSFLSEAVPDSKIAYAVPTYEVDERVPFPKSKKEIVDLANQGLARPFHIKIFRLNQLLTNFKRWEKEEDSDGFVRVAYNASNYQFGYEPLYIASDDSPPHDERFIGYGFTRNTQVYEMAVSGYIFSVLSPAFTVHWGFQSLKTRPKWRKSQLYRNRLKMKGFMSEVMARYGIEHSQPKNV